MNLKKKESEIVTESHNDAIRNLAIIIALACAFVLFIFAIISMSIKCAINVEATDSTRTGFLFERACFGIGNDEVVYDKDTKVMYVRYRDSYTLLVNADGTPRLYEEDE